MKKFFSFSLALLLCAALSVPALAAEREDALVLDGPPSNHTNLDEEINCLHAILHSEIYSEQNPIEDWYIVEPKSKFTVTNTSADSTAYACIYCIEFKLMPNGSTGKIWTDEVGTFTTIDLSGKYAALDYLNLSTSPDSDDGGLSAGNGLYWIWSPASSMIMDDDNVKLLHAGEKVTFELPQGDKNTIYRLYTEIYYPQDNHNYYWKYYNIKLGDVTSSAPETSSASAFSDVAAGAYYADAVKWAVEKGITAGTTATTFSPNNTCTTAQILTFLWRANGSPAPTGNNAAVPAGQYYTDAANWALEKGLTDNFSADTPATRAATVTYLWKLAGKPAAEAAAFTDVDAGAEYAQAVAWAVKKGVTAGTSATTFAPDNTCTRGQIVTFLYRDLA